MAYETKLNFVFDKYRQDIKNVWEEYLLLDFSLSYVKEAHKKETITKALKRELFFEKTHYDYKDIDIHNLINTLLVKKLGSKALVEAVSLTEHFLQDLATYVYKEYPNKLDSISPQADTPALEIKMIKLILNSNDKEEMIDSLIEEKMRGVFYGNPMDFFIKDKAKIGFSDFFKNNFTDALDAYKEIISRRNIIIHNNGIVDSKYLREVVNSPFKKGHKPKIDKEYIRHAIIILRGISAVSMQLVIENIYNRDVKGRRFTRMANSLKKYTNGL